MGELAVYLIQHVGLAGFVVAVGFILDHVCSPELKVKVVQWVNTKNGPPSLQQVLSSFLEGFMDRLFGSRLFSTRFFIRSSLVSFCLLTIAWILLVRANELDASLLLQELNLTSPPGIVLLVMVVFFNFFIDYLSNIETIALLRMAALSGRAFDTLIVFLADLTLTVMLFSVLFPFVIVAALLVAEQFDSGQIFHAHLVKYSEAALRDNDPTWFLKSTSSEALKLQAVEFKTEQPSAKVGGGSDVKWRLFAFYVRPNRTEKEIMLDIADILRQDSEIKISRVTNSEIELLFNAKIPDFSYSSLSHYYKSVFVYSEVADNFFPMIILRPVKVTSNSVYQLMAQERTEQTLMKCPDGKIIWPKDENEICEALIAISAPEKNPFFMLSASSLKGSSFLESPFFFTSFASSLLYYSMLIAVGGFALIMKTFHLVFVEKYLDVTGKPFTVISLFLFVCGVMIELVVRAISFVTSL